MIKIIVIAYLVSLYISLPGFFTKAGYSAIAGLIPIYNVYVLVQILEIHPIILIILSLGLIFLPDRILIVTLMCIFLPFMLADAYAQKPIIGLFCAVLPFFMYPLLAYTIGTYCYSMEDE